MTDPNGALARYRVAMRRQRIIYFSIVGAIIAALIVTVSVAWARGEVANTTLRTTSEPPAALPVATATTSARAVWRTADRAAIGSPQYRGTVVVYGKHTVRGLDARTGAQTWSYNRSNRTVCAALQTAGTTIAFYRVGGNCDEVTALHSGTGRRAWTRTLDENGLRLNGSPTYQVVQSSEALATIVITTPQVIYAIDPGSGIDRWTYQRYGCTIRHTVLGSAGALISQDCAKPRCTAQKFCARGPQLLLRDGVAGADNKSTDNPDRIKWNLIGNTDVPVSADQVISALNTTTRALDTLDVTTGKPTGSLALSPAPSPSGAASASEIGGPELVSIGDVSGVVVDGALRPTWTRRTGSVPTVVSTTNNLALGTARITVATTGGAAILDGEDGQVAQPITLSPRPAVGSLGLVYPLGAGQLVAGAGGTVAYR